MSHATPSMRDFAKRLIAQESRGKKPSKKSSLVGFYACNKLRPHLANIMGNIGFRTLLARSLVLAATEVSWLRVVRVNADWSLQGLEELEAKLDADELFEGGVVFLARLLGLMVLLIGENLTIRLLTDVWPEVSLNDLNFGSGGKYEEAK